jgi:nitrite reductase/ring-hydroxylating ferredoxin subunit
LHGSYFDLETGEALNEPADEPIKAYKTLMKDNNICIEL